MLYLYTIIFKYKRKQLYKFNFINELINKFFSKVQISKFDKI